MAKLLYKAEADSEITKKIPIFKLIYSLRTQNVTDDSFPRIIRSFHRNLFLLIVLFRFDLPDRLNNIITSDIKKASNFLKLIN